MHENFEAENATPVINDAESPSSMDFPVEQLEEMVIPRFVVAQYVKEIGLVIQWMCYQTKEKMFLHQIVGSILTQNLSLEESREHILDKDMGELDVETSSTYFAMCTKEKLGIEQDRTAVTFPLKSDEVTLGVLLSSFVIKPWVATLELYNQQGLGVEIPVYILIRNSLKISGLLDLDEG